MKKLLTLLSSVFLIFAMSNVFADMMQDTKDAAITTEVKSMLFEKKMVHDEGYNVMDVKVETVNGEVFLKGHVKNEQAKMKAEKIAKSAKGVMSVNNQLSIR